MLQNSGYITRLFLRLKYFGFLLKIACKIQLNAFMCRHCIHFSKQKYVELEKKNVENKRRWIESDLNYCIDKCTVYKGKGFRQKLNTQFLGWAGLY